MLDWLIRGAQVLDGTGADAFPADVGIKDGTIAAVGRLTDADAATEILTVAPPELTRASAEAQISLW